MSECWPVLDLSDYPVGVEPGSVSQHTLQKLASSLVEGLERCGLVYLTNHGITSKQVQRMSDVADTFFSLPDASKAKYQRSEGDKSGWLCLGGECLNRGSPFDYKETMQLIAPLDMKWPEQELPGFREETTRFLHQCEDLATRVLQLIACGLELSDYDFFARCHNFKSEDNYTMVRLNHYPPISPAHPVEAGHMRCGLHTDYHTLTLLFQDDIGGLQMKKSDGSFVDVPPLDGSVIVNTADLLQRWTADRLMAPLHRVVMPTHQMSLHTRRSIAYFVVPDKDTLVTCLDGSNKYPPMNSQECILQRVHANKFNYV